MTGKVISVDGSSVTVQTPGRRGGIVPALITAANAIDHRNLPYVYGGGHEQAGVASIGIPGNGYDGHRIGFDCSGAVGAVLVGGGQWSAFSGVPADNGIISQLRAEGKIAPGVGRGPVEVTLYDYPTVHIFMNINGRFFGTSDGGDGGHGGGGWLNDGAPDASSSHYHALHLLPSVLRSGPSGEVFTFTADGLGQFLPGDKIKVAYRQSRWGSLIATAVTYPNAKTVTGTVASMADDGSSFTISDNSGGQRTFSISSGTGVLDHVAVGDTVRVKYTKRAGILTARQLVVTATPAPTSGPTGPGGNPTGSPPSPSTASHR
ncbi:MAG TPA: hypothetical protein VGY32_00845 [Solirubrobacteraceae bacterium]|nr:hypothetical protein [Solirubrobacteraceae bacterium]